MPTTAVDGGDAPRRELVPAATLQVLGRIGHGTSARLLTGTRAATTAHLR